MVGLLKLVSRYRFVTTSEQLEELVKLATERMDSLKDTLILVDCNLLYTRNRNSKMLIGFYHVLQVSRKMSIGVILVANTGTKLDKRLEYQVSHITRLMSTELPYTEEVR